MRNMGGILMLLGVIGFFYCSSEMDKAERPNPDASITETLRTPEGQWEIARYLCAGAAGIGALLALFPRGR